MGLVLLNPVLALAGLGIFLGGLLGFAARRFHVTTDPVVEKINELLPQTQCGQCGHPGCKPYAEAMAKGAAINKCPPGGEATIARLAELLNLPPQPLDPAYGTAEARKVAVIREAECIGCAKCIPACPVDAILGAPRHTHTVIESECTGCDLCVDPCPVDCIDMVTVAADTGDLCGVDSSHQACIRCGLCVDACPVDILPQELYWVCRSHEHAKALELKLMHCIECGRCDAVCPSGIPLVDYYQRAKTAVGLQREDRARADRARQRFEYHQLRMERINEEAEQRRRKRADLTARDRQTASSDSIQAALARARQKADSQ